MIRPATADDRPAILEVVREAFTGNGQDGHEEVEIVQETWARDAAPAGYELVAVEDSDVVGHVLAARGDLDGREVLGVAPLAVIPSRQDDGIGSALMHELLRRAEENGLPLVVILGAPAYYGRFGFEPSGPLDITYGPAGPNSPHFQVRRFAGYDPTYRGVYRYCWELDQ